MRWLRNLARWYLNRSDPKEQPKPVGYDAPQPAYQLSPGNGWNHVNTPKRINSFRVTPIANGYVVMVDGETADTMVFCADGEGLAIEVRRRTACQMLGE